KVSISIGLMLGKNRFPSTSSKQRACHARLAMPLERPASIFIVQTVEIGARFRRSADVKNAAFVAVHRRADGRTP
ncbi:MAG TPA: hypothetical protein VF428_13440, partial [Casimicrobiaceae bacterium]